VRSATTHTEALTRPQEEEKVSAAHGIQLRSDVIGNYFFVQRNERLCTRERKRERGALIAGLLQTCCIHINLLAETMLIKL